MMGKLSFSKVRCLRNNTRLTKKFALFVAKSPGEEWPPFDPEGFYLFVLEYDPLADEFKPQRNVRMAKVRVCFLPSDVMAIIGYVFCFYIHSC
jgi:hypothetical protein